MKRTSSESETEKPSTSVASGRPDEVHTSKMAHEKATKRVGKRPGRKPSKIDVKAKLERSRQSARECRARKKLRYQYLEELVSRREKTVFSLREELERYMEWCKQLDAGILPQQLVKHVVAGESSQAEGPLSMQRQQQQHHGIEENLQSNFPTIHHQFF
ncbi:cAMP-responsive element-binding protein-like 2 isoform X1 [Pomacea canaliculata]|uniref:cAMP-responsive element-binding protein-like 2 isoform X1 n=1 Tax=Pomacea canaliculata TaxID=400727 RepID=UPI000D7326E1|nr:cAMP-responsive element-binding protein-like 2 isoform X1 [Pomacea canaliculata]